MQQFWARIQQNFEMMTQEFHVSFFADLSKRWASLSDSITIITAILNH